MYAIDFIHNCVVFYCLGKEEIMKFVLQEILFHSCFKYLLKRNKSFRSPSVCRIDHILWYQFDITKITTCIHFGFSSPLKNSIAKNSENSTLQKHNFTQIPFEFIWPNTNSCIYVTCFVYISEQEHIGTKLFTYRFLFLINIFFHAFVLSKQGK